jgi:hypothetical protein
MSSGDPGARGVGDGSMAIQSLYGAWAKPPMRRYFRPEYVDYMIDGKPETAPPQALPPRESASSAANLAPIS